MTKSQPQWLPLQNVGSTIPPPPDANDPPPLLKRRITPPRAGFFLVKTPMFCLVLWVHLVEALFGCVPSSSCIFWIVGLTLATSALLASVVLSPGQTIGYWGTILRNLLVRSKTFYLSNKKNFKNIVKQNLFKHTRRCGVTCN